MDAGGNGMMTEAEITALGQRNARQLITSHGLLEAIAITEEALADRELSRLGERRWSATWHYLNGGQR